METYAKYVQTSVDIYCGSGHPSIRFLSCGKKCAKCSKSNHFRDAYRGRREPFATWKRNQNHHEEVDHIDMVNINSVYFNNKHSVIAANLKASSNQASIILTYKVDTGSNGNIMPLHIHKNYFLRQQKNTW